MTLVEVLIAMTLLGIVGSAVIGVLVRQQRLSARTAALTDTRDQSRFTLGALAGELRGLSSIGGDIDQASMSATALRIRTNVGMSVICAIGAGRTSFTIPPTSPVNPGNRAQTVVLTSFVDPSAPPTVNDTVWVFNTILPNQTPWDSVRVTNSGLTTVSGALGCPGSNTPSDGRLLNAAQAGAAGALSFSVPVDRALPAGVVVGSPVRFTRSVRYSFYQDAADNQWYLGFQSCSGLAGCGGVQPVSGPFLPATGNPLTTGFRFVYLDSLGAATTVARDVARIQIVTRAMTRDAISTGSGVRSQFVQVDSIMVALRNRS